MSEPTGEFQETPPQESAEAPETPAEPPDEQEQGDGSSEGGEPAEDTEEPESSGQPQGKSEKDIEKAMEALDREAKRHAKRIGEIMEEDAQALLPCELCAQLMPGFRWPQVPEDQRAAVLLAIGFDPEPDLRRDTQSAVCPDCDGWGQVATGSKVQGQKALPCTACKGKGWRGPRENQDGSILPSNVPAELLPIPQTELVSDPEREAAKRTAEAAGYMVIDTRTPAQA